MKTRTQIIEQQASNDGPTTLIPFPAQYHYKTVDEGVIKGAYGRHINHVVEANMFADLCKNEHTVAFYTISAEMVVAAITWSNKLENYDEPPIDERTVFTITCSFRGMAKAVILTGQVIHLLEPFNIPGSVKLIVTNRHAGWFEEIQLSTRVSEINEATQLTYLCEVSVVVSDKLARNDVNGMNRLLDNDTRQWHPLFLNQSFRMQICMTRQQRCSPHSLMKNEIS